jgi:hypothetical protein
MNWEVCRHLMAWELRQTLRRAPFWAMLLLSATVPLAAAAWWGHADDGSGLDLAVLVPAQTLTLSLLVSSWIVFSVKRLVARDVSDDWLLVITYRHALAARYGAGVILGLVLALANVAAATLAVACLAPHQLPAAVGGLEPMVMLSLLQPLAVAAVLVGAADFLLAPAASVLFIQLFAAGVWTIIPVGGFWWCTNLTAESSGAVMPPIAALYLCLSCGACGLLAWFGWRRSEDFWLMAPEERRGRGYDASVGEVRGALQTAGRPKQGADRAAAIRLRMWFDGHGVEPWMAHDLARYRWWNLPRGSFALDRLIKAAVIFAPVALVYTGCMMFRHRGEHLGFYWAYFLWWALVAGTVLRALSSGTQIVLAEREQGTLPGLVLSPLGLRRVLNAKLGVVVVQALPSLLILAAVLQYGGIITSYAWSVGAVAVSAAIAGIVAGTLTRNRLMATLVAVLLAVPLSAVGLYVRMVAFDCVAWSAFGLPHHWSGIAGLVAYHLVQPSSTLLPVLLTWLALRPLAAAALRRTSAERRT